MTHESEHDFVVRNWDQVMDYLESNEGPNNLVLRAIQHQRMVMQLISQAMNEKADPQTITALSLVAISAGIEAINYNLLGIRAELPIWVGEEEAER